MPTFAEHDEALRSALGHVAEHGFVGFAVPIDGLSFADLVRHSPLDDLDLPATREPWVVTEVSFTGTFDGAIEVAMNEALARQLLQAFLGLGPDDPTDEDQLFDMTREFSSQVCGAWLTGACGDRRFDLGRPDAVRQSLEWLPLDAAPADEHDGQILVSVNDQPLRMRVRFAPENVA